MRWIRRAEAVIVSVEKTVITAAMFVLLAAGLIQVVIRAMGFRSIGTDEVTSVMMVALIFIGAALTTATGDSISVEVADIIKSARIRWFVKLVVLLITVLFGCVFTFFAFEFMNVALASGEKSLQLSIPKALPTGLMALGGALLTLHAVISIPGHLAQWSDPDPEENREHVSLAEEGL